MSPNRTQTSRGWTLLLVLMAGLSLTAALARSALVPGVSATGQAQPLWAVETAFVLVAVEYIAGFGALLVALAAVLRWAKQRTIGGATR
jgi:hypothetical protein